MILLLLLMLLPITSSNYLTTVMVGYDTSQAELTNVVLQAAEEAFSEDDVSIAMFLSSNAKRIGQFLPDQVRRAIQMESNCRQRVREARNIHHRGLSEAIADAAVLQYLRGGSKALSVAFRIWERQRLRNIVRNQHKQQQQQQQEMWYMHTTKLFRLLANAWDLEHASIVGKEAVAMGRSLLKTAVPDGEGYYLPFERAKLFHKRTHENHPINLSLRAMIAAARSSSGGGDKEHRELVEDLEEMFVMDHWKKRWMDKSGIRNNLGNYVMKDLLPTMGMGKKSNSTAARDAWESMVIESMLDDNDEITSHHHRHLERCREKVATAMETFSAGHYHDDNDNDNDDNGDNDDVAREDARTITKADLYERYINRGRPFILTHFFDRAAATERRHWNRAQWDIDKIVHTHRNSTVLITRSSSIATRQHLHYSIPQALSTTEKLGSFYSSMYDDEHYENCDPPYLFAKMTENERENLFGRSFSELTSLFEDERFHFTDEERLASALFYIGPELSGAYFHSHTNAVNILAKGRKLWHLFPPGVSHGPVLGNLVDWMGNVLPLLKQKPLTLIQRSGELLFVPTAWSHATLNLETALGVAIEIGVDVELTTNH